MRSSPAALFNDSPTQVKRLAVRASISLAMSIRLAWSASTGRHDSVESTFVAQPDTQRGHAEERRRRATRQPQSTSARELRRARVRYAEPRSFREPGRAVRFAFRRLAAM